MADKRTTGKELRSMVERMTGDEEIGLRFFANGVTIPYSPEGHEFFLQAMKRLLEAGVGFAIVHHGGRVGIFGGEDTYDTDVIPEMWSDGRWHLGREPSDDIDDTEDIYGPHPP